MKVRVSFSVLPVVCVLFGALALGQAVFAQEAITPGTVTFLGHVTHMAPLAYPETGGAASAGGTVVLSVEVGTDGSVIAAKAISGSSALVQAAVACAKQWKFKPFKKDGKKVIADGKLSFTFSPENKGLLQSAPAGSGSQAGAATEVAAKSEAGAKRETGVGETGNNDVAKAGAKSTDGGSATNFNSLWKQCSDAVIHNAPGAETVLVCKKAADVAATFPPDTKYLEKRSAFIYAATAYANDGDFKNGEIYAQKAVALVKLDRKNEPGNGEVYSTLAHIEAMQGDLAGADLSLDEAEKYDRKSIAWAKKNEAAWVPQYVSALQADLRFHSLVLRDMKRKHEAKKKLEEATELSQ